jgi:sulfur carrier protein
VTADPSAEPGAGELRLWVNGEPLVVATSTTLARLVAEAAGGGRGIAVAVDGQVVPRSAWVHLRLEPGARVEIVTAASGG